MKCPCEEGVPCADADGRVLTPEEFKICDGVDVTPVRQGEFIHELLNPELTLYRKALNYGMSMTKHAMDKFRNVTPETKAYRLGICEKCDYLSKDSRRVCMQCGCPVDTKAGWASERCPMSYWEAVSAPPAAPRPPDAPKGGCGCQGA